MGNKDRIGLDFLTLLGASPTAFIRTAKAAGARNVALFMENLINPFGRPPFSLIEDKALRRETRACAEGEGINIAMVDGFCIFPDRPVEAMRPAFDMVAEIGCAAVSGLSFEPDLGRTADKWAALMAIGAEYDMTLMIEPCPRYPVSSVADALGIIEHAGSPHLKLNIDTMHISRSGELELLGRIDPDLIAYLQICDGLIAYPSNEAYREEALYERGIPGTGEMPLVDFVRTIHPHVVISGEVPQRSRIAAGVSDLEIARSVIAGIEKVMAEAAV